MSARNFYIMQSAVAPMQSETPCYTPLTNHRTEVHTVPLVMAADYAALEARLSEARKVLEWIAKWGYGDGGRECAEKAAEWLEKNGANQTRGRGHEQ